jgi:hypothetical protein
MTRKNCSNSRSARWLVAATLAGTAATMAPLAAVTVARAAVAASARARLAVDPAPAPDTEVAGTPAGVGQVAGRPEIPTLACPGSRGSRPARSWTDCGSDRKVAAVPCGRALPGRRKAHQ